MHGYIITRLDDGSFVHHLIEGRSRAALLRAAYLVVDDGAMLGIVVTAQVDVTEGTGLRVVGV